MNNLPVTNKEKWEFRNKENYVLKSSNELIMEAIFSTGTRSINSFQGEIGNFTCHKQYSDGLNLALQNYLNGLGVDVPLQEWFDFEIMPTTHPNNLIASFLK